MGLSASATYAPHSSTFRSITNKNVEHTKIFPAPNHQNLPQFSSVNILQQRKPQVSMIERNDGGSGPCQRPNSKRSPWHLTMILRIPVWMQGYHCSNTCRTTSLTTKYQRNHRSQAYDWLFNQNYCLGPKILIPEARMLISRQRLRKTAVNKLLVTVDRWQFSPRGEKKGRCKLHQCMRLKAKVSRYEHRVQFQVDTYTLLTVDIPPPSVPTSAVHTP